MKTQKPTSAELIERIDQRIANDMDSGGTSTLLKVLRAHLSDPWIPVEERLPGDSYQVLAVSVNRVATVACYVDGEWRRNTDWLALTIPHWCPLPPLPKKGGEA